MIVVCLLYHSFSLSMRVVDWLIIWWLLIPLRAFVRQIFGSPIAYFLLALWLQDCFVVTFSDLGWLILRILVNRILDGGLNHRVLPSALHLIWFSISSMLLGLIPLSLFIGRFEQLAVLLVESTLLLLSHQEVLVHSFHFIREFEQLSLQFCYLFSNISNLFVDLPPLLDNLIILALCLVLLFLQLLSLGFQSAEHLFECFEINSVQFLCPLEILV